MSKNSYILYLLDKNASDEEIQIAEESDVVDCPDCGITYVLPAPYLSLSECECCCGMKIKKCWDD